MTLMFGGSDNKFTSFEKAKVVILPVPYGKTVTYLKGTENGPEAILEASDNLELFDEELGKETCLIGINTAPLLKVNDSSPEDMIASVEEKTADIYKQDKMPVIIGGEHTLTIGAVRAAKTKFKDLSILYFDAHGDLRNEYAGNKYSHACVARRLLEIAPVIEVGVRSLSKEENDFASSEDIKIIKMFDMLKGKDWLGAIKKQLSKNIYISIDLDVVDPSIIPSVGSPEPGGIQWYEFLKAMREIIAHKNVVGLDVVELCPVKGILWPDFTAAKLIYKILGYIFC